MAEVEELRVQPQDILAEQSVLGAIFIDESKLVFVREYIESRDFFKYAHRLIFQAMVDSSAFNRKFCIVCLDGGFAKNGDKSSYGDVKLYLSE